MTVSQILPSEMTAIAISEPGGPDGGAAGGGQQGIDVNIFPTQYLVDYVRVYDLVKDNA